MAERVVDVLEVVEVDHDQGEPIAVVLGLQLQLTVLEEVAAMVAYFREAPPEDAAWAVHFLIGRRPKRLISGPKMWGWAAELAGLPLWLFGECYDAVGDLAETIALVESGEATPATSLR